MGIPNGFPAIPAPPDFGGAAQAQGLAQFAGMQNAWPCRWTAADRAAVDTLDLARSEPAADWLWWGWFLAMAAIALGRVVL